MRFCLSLLSLLILHHGAVSELISSRLSKKCIEVPFASKRDNAQVKQFTCSKQPHFQLDTRPQGNFFQLQFRHSKKCAGVMNGAAGAGAIVVQTPCRNGVDSQLWQVKGKGKMKQVVAKHSRMCMTLANSDTRNGAGIIQFPCAAGAKNNYWKIKAKAPNGSNTQTGPTTSPPPPITPPAGGSSKWNGPYRMSIVPVAAANLPDGRILTWSSYTRMSFKGRKLGQTWTAIFNPATNRTSEALIENTKHDMFCPGTAVLPDGRIAITGGARAYALTLYNPSNNTWTRGPGMKIRRGYHSMTMLADGTVFTLGGSFSGGRGGKDGEVWDLSDKWQLKTNIKSTGSLLTNDKEGVYRSDNHMWLFTAPNGKVFHAGPSPRTHWITTAGAGSVRQSVMRGNVAAMNGNAVMYDIGKILITGGSKDYNKSGANNSAFVVDLNRGDNASVRQVGNMTAARVFHNSVVLPSGEVVVVGGQTRAEIFKDSNKVMRAEIWNPKTGKFRGLASMRVARTYHSVAILMKDGRVWVGGGGLCGACGTNHPDSEIFTPPYLLNGNGRPAVRPIIQSVSAKSARAGNIITVRVNSNAAHSFAVVRLSAVTHSVNNDGRRFPLAIASRNGNTFRLKIPNNRAVALAGSYFLFAMNGARVPSVARILRINP